MGSSFLTNFTRTTLFGGVAVLCSLARSPSHVGAGFLCWLTGPVRGGGTSEVRETPKEKAELSTPQK